MLVLARWERWELPRGGRGGGADGGLEGFGASRGKTPSPGGTPGPCRWPGSELSDHYVLQLSVSSRRFGVRFPAWSDIYMVKSGVAFIRNICACIILRVAQVN